MLILSPNMAHLLHFRHNLNFPLKNPVVTSPPLFNAYNHVQFQKNLMLLHFGYNQNFPKNIPF